MGMGLFIFLYAVIVIIPFTAMVWLYCSELYGMYKKSKGSKKCKKSITTK